MRLDVGRCARTVSNDIDRAQAADAVNAQDALERQRIAASKLPRLQGIGECLNPHCAEPFPANDNQRLYCGPDCETAHRKMRRAS